MCTTLVNTRVSTAIDCLWAKLADTYTNTRTQTHTRTFNSSCRLIGAEIGLRLAISFTFPTRTLLDTPDSVDMVAVRNQGGGWEQTPSDACNEWLGHVLLRTAVDLRSALACFVPLTACTDYYRMQCLLDYTNYRPEATCAYKAVCTRRWRSVLARLLFSHRLGKPDLAFSARRGHLVTFKRCLNPETESVGLQMSDRNHRARMRRPPFRTWDGRATGPARHMEHSCGAYVEVLSSRASSLCERSACTPSVASPFIPPSVCAC